MCELLLRVLDTKLPCSKKLAEKFASRESIAILTERAFLHLIQLHELGLDRKITQSIPEVSGLISTAAVMSMGGRGVGGVGGGGQGIVGGGVSGSVRSTGTGVGTGHLALIPPVTVSSVSSTLPTSTGPNPTVPPDNTGTVASTGVGAEGGGEVTPPMARQAKVLEDAASPAKAALTFHSLLIINKLSDICPEILFESPLLITIIRQMVVLLVGKCTMAHEKSLSAAVPLNTIGTTGGRGSRNQTALLMQAYMKQHQYKTTTFLENNYRFAYQLKLICKIAIKYCRYKMEVDNLDLIFALSSVLPMKTCSVSYLFLAEFFSTELPDLCNTPYLKKMLLKRAISVLSPKNEPSLTVKHKVKVIQVL